MSYETFTVKQDVAAVDIQGMGGMSMQGLCTRTSSPANATEVATAK